MLKKIGIVGGVGWLSTADYYRLICSASNAHFKAQGVEPPYPSPPIMIESLNMAVTRKLRGIPGTENGWEKFDAVFRDAFLRLEQAGCAFGLIASNTPHSRLHAIGEGITMPLLSIFDESVAATKSSGATHALILGTSVTMRAENYPSLLRAVGIIPNEPLEDQEIDRFQNLIDTEFYDHASEHGRKHLLDMCRAHVKDPQNTAILLACTELPLAFPEFGDDAVFETDGFCFVNTSAAHAKAALNKSLDL